MLLTVDLGNTTAAAAVFDAGAIVYRGRRPTPRAWSPRQFSALLPARRARRVSAAIVSSVVPRLDRPLAAAIRRACGVRPLFLNPRTPTGMPLTIDRPAGLGADRIAACAGALALFPPPLVVIDAGTAITFDLVNSRGEYCGGCILPGIGIAIRSLAERTAKLRQVRFSVPASPLGARTADCIRSGVYFGTIGALRHLVALYRETAGRGATVVATGGLWPSLQGRVPGIDAFEPDLVFQGLRRIHAGLKGRGA